MGWTSIGKNLRGGELDSHHNILEVVSKGSNAVGEKKDLMDTVKEGQQDLIPDWMEKKAQRPL